MLLTILNRQKKVKRKQNSKSKKTQKAKLKKIHISLLMENPRIIESAHFEGQLYFILCNIISEITGRHQFNSLYDCMIVQ